MEPWDLNVEQGRVNVVPEDLTGTKRVIVVPWDLNVVPWPQFKYIPLSVQLCSFCGGVGIEMEEYILRMAGLLWNIEWIPVVRIGKFSPRILIRIRPLFEMKKNINIKNI